MDARLSKRIRRLRWRFESRKGCMIRRCLLTGRKEYRDCVRKAWIPFEDERELTAIRERLQHRDPF